MPLATKRPRWKPNDIVVCWCPFVDTVLDRAVKHGERLKGSDPAVERHPELFLADGEPVPTDVRAVVEAATPAPEPEPTGMVKVRMIGKHQTVIHDNHTYRSYEDETGDEFTVDAKTAVRLIDEGLVERVGRSK